MKRDDIKDALTILIVGFSIIGAVLWAFLLLFCRDCWTI